MNALTKFFIDNSKFTLVLTIGLLILGLQGLGKMNSESFPTVDFAQAFVTTRYDGASAEDIETKITKPIEDKIREVSGIKDVRSVSQSGLSSIYIRADMDNVENVDEVMADLQRSIDGVTGLPQDLLDDPIYTEIKSEEFPVLEIAVIGKNDQRKRDLIADLLKEEFEDNKLVKEARLVGFAPRRFQIRLDYQKLNEYHIGVREVLAKVKARNVNVPGGNLKDIEKQTLLRLEGKIKNAEELGDILIRSNFTGQKVYLKDIATVEDSEEEIKVLARRNGQEATLIIVSKKGGADTITLVNAIDKKLESFRKRYGNDYSFQVYNNESKKVANRLDVLTSNAVSGLVLVIVFLFIFLPGRIGLMASLSLPLAIMATMGLMPTYGMNLNAITILALVIALGMLVDNSVVIAENFTRLQGEGRTPMEAALESVTKLWLPITATAFTTIAAFLPMLVTKGIMGQFIKYIPIVVTISLIASLAESFFLLPMRLVLFGGKVKTAAEGHSDWFEKFQIKFEALMKWCVQRRYLMSVGFIVSFAISIFLMAVANKFILFPPDQTEIYIARVEMENGTRLRQTNNALKLLSTNIEETLGKNVSHIITRAGTSKMQPNDPKAKDGNNVGMATIYVTEEAKNSLSHIEALKELRKIAWQKYAKNISFEAMVNGPPVGNDIEATFRSNSNQDLNLLIGKIKDELSQTKGISDLKTDDVFGDNEVYIDIDYGKADQLGLNVDSIGSTVRAAIAGLIVSTVTLDNKDVDLMVRFKEPFRKNTKDLQSLMIMDNRGNLVPLGSIAKFHEISGTPQIKRYDFKRSKTLTGNVNDEFITAMKANKMLADLYDKFSFEFPSVSLVFGGVAESTQESLDSLKDALVLSLIGIFALLVFLFRSFLRPAIIMTTIPLGLLGFSIAFWAHQRPISFLALIGIIGLGGIIVNSGIVLISFIDQMRDEGEMELHDILVKASGLRLKAVLVTSLTTISGLIPTAYGIGGTDAILVPMTLAMAWGLTSGTVLTLIWVPCAYAILEDIVTWKPSFLMRKKSGSVNA
ncbi:MAG: efflux RND transporter permease subunit [Bacteriovoracaceae bacterium]|nr:efflux RND transporter permease subunit [Bacteriovoracaceae bacterium]